MRVSGFRTAQIKIQYYFVLSEVRENEAEEKQMKEIKKKSHIENYSLVFLLLSFLVFVATFILSRQECSQIHDRPAYNYEGVIQKEEIIETAAKNLEEDIREQKIKTCKSFDALPANWKTSESWEVGFIEAPKCPENELVIIVNTAYRNRQNRAVLRRYFGGKG